MNPTLKFLVTIASLGLVFSCKSRRFPEKSKTFESLGNVQDPPTALDVNDVSILYPVRNSSEAEKLLGVDVKLKNGNQLLPDSVFQKLVKLASAKETIKTLLINPASLALLSDPNNSLASVLAKNFASVPGPAVDFKTTESLPNNLHIVPTDVSILSVYKIVSFRFDPCAGGATGTDFAKCKTQIRLVAQPFGFRDTAIHVVYDFDFNQAASIAKKLLALKSNKTTGMPLGVHPGLEEEGVAGPLAKRFEIFLKETLAEGTLTALAFQGLHDPEPWIFLAGLVRGDDFELVTLDFGAENSGFQQTGPLDEENTVSPHFAPPRPNIAPLTQRLKEPTTAELEFINIINNPNSSALITLDQKNSRHMDCVSCHISTEQLFGHKKSVKSTKLFDKQSAFKTIEGISGYSAVLARGNWNVRAFGYQSVLGNNGGPSVAMRTLNETVVAADFSNKNLLKSGNPSDLKCKMQAVHECLIESDGDQKCFETNCSSLRFEDPTGALAPRLFLPLNSKEMTRKCEVISSESSGDSEFAPLLSSIRRSSTGKLKVGHLVNTFVFDVTGGFPISFEAEFNNSDISCSQKNCKAIESAENSTFRVPMFAVSGGTSTEKIGEVETDTLLSTAQPIAGTARSLVVVGGKLEFLKCPEK